MSRLSYRDPDTGTWVPIPTVGPTGPAGPAGPAGLSSTGPTGPTGSTGATGPAGADGVPGPSAVSADAGNVAILGTDNLIFVATPGSSDTSTEGHLLTAIDDAGSAEWQAPPILVSEGPPARSNLLTQNQQTLDAGLTGWGQAWQSTLSIGTMQNHECLRVTTTTTGNGSGLTPTHTSQGTVVPATPGQTFTASALYAGGNAGGQVGLDFRDAAGARIGTLITSAIAPASTTVTTRLEVSAVAPAGTVAVSVTCAAINTAATVGHHANFDDIYLWDVSDPTEVPENPLAINVGTVYSRQGCLFDAAPATTIITSTVAFTQVPDSKSVTFTLVTPAMVTGRATLFMYQYADTSKVLYAAIGVKNSSGTIMYTDDYGAPSTSTNYPTAIMYSNAGGRHLVPASTFWKRLLDPGTYTIYPTAWVNAVDSASVKYTGIFTIELVIDPGQTYLTGQRA